MDQAGLGKVSGKKRYSKGMLQAVVTWLTILASAKAGQRPQAESGGHGGEEN